MAHIFAHSDDSQSPSKKGKFSNDLIVNIPVMISKWKQQTIDLLGIFYSRDPLDNLDALLDKSKQYTPNIPEFPSTLIPVFEMLKNFYTFDISDFKGHRDLLKHQRDVSLVAECGKKLKQSSFREYMLQNLPKDGGKVMESLLASVWVAASEFLDMLLYFMAENEKLKAQHCGEMMYQELHRAFFRACGLVFRRGECTKKVLSIGRLCVSSQPSLTCTCYNKMEDVEQWGHSKLSTVIMVGETKRTLFKRHENTPFRIQDLEDNSMLGRHGGELLVELNDTCFTNVENGNQLVFGAMCIGTKVVFTALEMNEEHLNEISTVEDNDEEKCQRKSQICYTQPYDLLKKNDRDKMYKSLLRLSSFQRNY